MAGWISWPHASTPQGFVWNTGFWSLSRTSNSGFNPTRVRLERDGRPVEPRRPRASTPQGFVWNFFSLKRSSSNSELQPHKGSSGTTRCCSPSSTVGCFNPTRVRLERQSVDCGSSSTSKLQPHKGSSGTTSATPPSSPTPRASTPQGFVWNHADPSSNFSLSSLQPHKGSSGTMCRFRCACWQKCFNPTRVRLEHLKLLRHCTRMAASTPQGFVWNANLARS